MKPVKDGSKIFIKNKRTGKFLFFLRDDKPTIPNPDMWDLLGGGIEDGETPEDAVKREIKEETNLEIESVELIKTRNVVHTVQGRKYPITSYVFKTEVDVDENDVEFFEGQKIKWFTFSEIKNKKIIPTILSLFVEFENKI